MATIYIVNNKRADEKVIDNAGAKTGAKKSEFKFNTFMLPLPATNVQVAIAPGEYATIVTSTLLEEKFFEALDIPGVTVTDTSPEPAEPYYVYTLVPQGEGAPTWAENTYYSKSGDTYVLTETEPDDWETKYYTNYYTRSIKE